MTATATAPKLTARQARQLHDAEVAYEQLEAQLAIAKETRDSLRGKFRDRIPLSDDPDEAAKGIRAALIGGISLRATPMSGANSFSLKRYVELGHQVTDAMRDAIKPGKPYDRWTVKDASGPKRHDAVEPRR